MHEEVRQSDILELLDDHFEISMLEKRTTFPVIVEKFYLDECKVDVKPAHKFKIIETGQIVEAALIRDVPVVFPSSSGSIDIYPLKKGDIGQVLISDRSISEWLSGNGTPIYPKNPNIMEVSQATFLPGGKPFELKSASPLPENARSIIVEPGTYQYFGSSLTPMVLNGGTLEIWNVLLALTTIVATHDVVAAGGANAATLAELLALIPTIKVDP